MTGMSDPEDFYAELDARMAMPEEDWHEFSARGPNTSGSSEPLPSNNDPIYCATTPLVQAVPTRKPPSASAEEPQRPEGEGGSEQPLSTKRGWHHYESSVPATSVQRGRNTVSIVAASAPASIQDMTSLIEEFTDVADSPAAKRKRANNAKPRPFVEETSTVTTPGNTPRTGARARSEASVVPPKVTSMAKQSAASKKKKTAKPELVTPPEFARRLRDQGRDKALESSAKLPVKAVQPPQHLKDYVIFYTGGDLTYASARTRGCMSYIHKHGGAVLPTFDPTTATHIVTETNEKNTLRALGLKNLSDIPLEIPTVKWNWVISGKPIPGEKDKQQMDYEFMHAAFSSRMDAGRALATGRDKGKQKLDVNAGQALLTGAQQRGETPPQAGSDSSSRESSHAIGEEEPRDLLQGPPPQMHMGREIDPAGPGRRRSRSPSSEGPPAYKAAPRKKLRGFVCDDPVGTAATNAAPCVNQDIVDKLSELAELHRAKPTQDDKWRVLGYTKAIAALRRCSERITSLEQAMSLNGVGEKTALKIMEIVETGALRRVDAERTEDVAAAQLFQGIYGVGQSTAYAWYLAGCRTLEDVKQRKGGIELSHVQVIGLKYYDDINARMPREEASEIFGEIRSIALSLDPKLFVEIMGSYRRSVADDLA
ncbi:hypothetical protein BJV78DRAFT_1204329 [Lactifluus subvellereus]|nr:hypothetical protein BJV78DRAFT_1204329 [Lactifluus subvellereus]